MGIIAWIIVGLIAGWLAGLIMKGGGYGLIGDLILGLIGALIGGWLFSLILPSAEPSGLIGSIIVATIGAVVLVAIVRLVGDPCERRRYLREPIARLPPGTRESSLIARRIGAASATHGACAPSGNPAAVPRVGDETKLATYRASALLVASRFTECRALVSAPGLRLRRVIPTVSPNSILECVRA